MKSKLIITIYWIVIYIGLTEARGRGEEYILPRGGGPETIA